MEADNILESATEDDFIATVGDVKEAAANAADEVASVVIEQVQEISNTEETKWLNLNLTIQALTESVTSLTTTLSASLIANQAATLSAMAAMQETLTSNLSPQPLVIAAPETPQPESKPLEEKSLVAMAENPLTTIADEAQSIVDKKPRKNWI